MSALMSGELFLTELPSSWDKIFCLRAPHLGRELVCKESKKNFKATIAMSQDFPLSIES